MKNFILAAFTFLVLFVCGMFFFYGINRTMYSSQQMSRPIEKPIPAVNERTMPIYIYMAVDKNSPEYKKELVPAGSYILSCDNYVVMQKAGEIVVDTQKEILEAALSALFNTPAQGMYVNLLKDNNIQLKNLEVIDNEYVITLSTKLPGYEDECATAQAKYMLEKTIEQNVGGVTWRVVEE